MPCRTIGTEAWMLLAILHHRSFGVRPSCQNATHLADVRAGAACSKHGEHLGSARFKSFTTQSSWLPDVHATVAAQRQHLDNSTKLEVPMDFQLVLCAPYSKREAELELLAACSQGYLETASLLLEAGADKDAEDSKGDTALILAAQGGHVDITRLLLDAGATEGLSCDGRTALMFAGRMGHVETARLLLVAGARKNRGITTATQPSCSQLRMAKWKSHGCFWKPALTQTYSIASGIIATSTRPSRSQLRMATRKSHGCFWKLALTHTHSLTTLATCTQPSCSQLRMATWLSHVCSWKLVLTKTSRIASATRP